MPAFTFEKLSSPLRRNPIPPDENKRRGRLVQLLERFVEMRAKRALRKEGATATSEQTSSE